MAAAVKARKCDLIEPVLVGKLAVINERLCRLGENPSNFEILDPKDSPLLLEFAEDFSTLRKNRVISLEDALKEVQAPLNFSAMMVRTNNADGTIGGAVETTSKTVSAALKIIGKAENTKTVSSFFLMVLDKPHHERKGPLIFADAGLQIEPSASQLSEIAQSSVSSFKALVSEEPKVAMLSFSTSGSARHKRVRLVSEATNLARLSMPAIKIDGELQFDAAFVPAVSQRKAKGSTVKGEANIMIFPNLDAANIGYKIAERLGGAIAIGPVLQGLKKPANDLSRGCSIDDIFYLMAVTSLQVK